MINAARANNIPELERLVATGTDINSKDDEGMTALMCAALHGHVEVAQYLVEAGAALNTARDDGKTALMFAAEKGHVELAQYLVGAGADLAARTGGSYAICLGTAFKTALMLAAENGNVEVAQYLEAAAAGKARERAVGAQASAAFFSAGSVTQMEDQERMAQRAQIEPLTKNDALSAENPGEGADKHKHNSKKESTCVCS